MVSYQTKDGKRHEFVSTTAASSWSFGIGSEVDILVHPNRPAEGEILGDGTKMFFLALAGMSGIQIVAAPIVYFFF